MSLIEIKNVLNKYHRFLITSHKRPEGDSFGSMIATALFLKKLNKEILVVNEDVIPANLDFLKFCEVKTASQAKRFNCDAAVILDCADLSRIGDVYNLITSKVLINIDHHISNTKFADVNWVDAQASSTAEMIFSLLKEMPAGLDEKIALCLYVGILTDTGSFKFSNTSPKTLEVCSRLLEFKIQPEKVSNLLYNRRSPASMRLLGTALYNLKETNGGQICWMTITPQMLKATGTKISECEEFIEFLRMIGPAKVVIIFYGLDEEKVRVSFRSKGAVDVNKIASFFNGGGHKLASGAEIEGDLEEVEQQVIKRTKAAFKNNS